MTLEEIEEQFQQVNEYSEPRRTKEMSQLMDILEREHDAFIFNPTPDELKKPAIFLYRKISLARNL